MRVCEQFILEKRCCCPLSLKKLKNKEVCLFDFVKRICQSIYSNASRRVNKSSDCCIFLHMHVLQQLLALTVWAQATHVSDDFLRRHAETGCLTIGLPASIWYTFSELRTQSSYSHWRSNIRRLSLDWVHTLKGSLPLLQLNPLRILLLLLLRSLYQDQHFKW